MVHTSGELGMPARESSRMATTRNGFTMAACLKASCTSSGIFPQERRETFGKYCYMNLNFYTGIFLIGTRTTLLKHFSNPVVMEPGEEK